MDRISLRPPVVPPSSPSTVSPVTDDELLAAFAEASRAVREALDDVDDLEAPGERPGQYRLDLAADTAVLDVLLALDVGVVSEESGRHRPDRELVVVVDPVDGSTNASLGLPWYAASFCAVDQDGLRCAHVENLATRVVYRAVRGGGATLDGEPLRVGRAEGVADAILAFSGYPRSHLGWAQFRSLGAAALDLCAVAQGSLAGFVECAGGLSPWDYLGGLLICHEAGACAADRRGDELVTVAPDARRSPVVACTQALHDELLAAAAGWHGVGPSAPELGSDSGSAR